MAISKGLFGEVSGKVKNLVIYQLKGQTIIRGIGRNHNPATALQLAIRQKVRIVIAFLKPIKPMIDLGYEWEITGTTQNQHNAATSYHIKNAIQGSYPDLSIDYPKAMISKGSLETARNPVARKLFNGISFTWDVAENMDWNIKYDRSMLLLYFPGINQSINIPAGACRCTGEDFVALDAQTLSEPVEVYIAFAASDRKSVSNSIYLGRL